jgi:hypothetical protein
MILPDDRPEVNTGRPDPLPVDDAGVPSSLKTLRRWVNWSWTWNGRKWDKPPLRLDGQRASSTDPGTWTDYTTALAGHREGQFDGIGFVLGKDPATGLVHSGLDLDDVRDPATGALQPWAQYAVAHLDSYTDVSPSRLGAKVFTLGRLPRGRRTDHDRGVEMYDGGRYFTVTGARLPATPAEVMERTRQMAELYAELLGEPAAADRGASTGGPPSDCALALSALAGLNPRRAVGYWDWLAVGMALHSVDPSEDMLAEWDRWSQACPEKYSPGVCTRKWASFGRGGITLGSLLHWARQDGWRPPRRQPRPRPTARRGRGHGRIRFSIEV